MRMRVKKWAKPELTACPFYVSEPLNNRGKWKDVFQTERPMQLELGCGKGVSTSLMAFDNPDVNFLAVDLITSVLGVAKRNAESTYADSRPVDNLLLTHFDIENIHCYIAPPDLFERIHISFCNPWTKRHRQHKHRLTHTRMLMRYREFLKDGGEIYFKTDDDELFNDTRRYLKEAMFDEVFVTYDLHNSGFKPNYVSEHEAMFKNAGIPIKFLIACKRSGNPIMQN